jgi:alpha-glucosidase
VKYIFSAALAASAIASMASPMAAHAVDIPALKSPDGTITVTLAHEGGGPLTYSIERNGEQIIVPSALRVRLAEGEISYGTDGGVNARSSDTVRKLVATKAAEARDRYNEVTVTLKPASGTPKELRWVFRAYDDGVAFRYVVPANAGLDTLSVRNEETEFGFAAANAAGGWSVLVGPREHSAATFALPDPRGVHAWLRDNAA